MAEKDQDTLKTSKSRIVYTEPNFVNGATTDGVDLSVPLEDLCIGVNLIAEVKTRFMTEISDGGKTDLYIASWNSKSENVSFFSGIKLDRNSDDGYLTSYFTDITYDDAKGSQVIEGLGIESIDINFESWFTPTVVIKFIDVRGSSMLVPNEYGNQVDDKTIFTGEKLYKCFFTFPYPKFRLEVKGFYGRPVTYHLTCSKFNGSFNSQNGNFEATATFIGYNYSLLTDIQFQYLIAAPYDSYYGQEYFKKNRSSEAWMLSGGIEMPTMKELINKIQSATGIIEEKLATDPNVIQNRAIANEKDALDNIMLAFSTMKSQLISDYNIITDVNNTKQLVIGFNSGDKINPIAYTNDFIRKYNNFIDLVNKYNENDLYSSRKISENVLPNKNVETLTENATFLPIKAFTIIRKDNIIQTINVDGNNSGEEVDKIIRRKQYNNDRKIDESLIKEITTLYKNKSEKIKEYIYLFNLNGFENEITNKLIDCDNRDASIQRDVDIFVKNAVVETVGFVPTIGNISKIIFAHLETFLASMYHCIETINKQVKNGERTLNNYKIKLNDTDLNYIDSNNALPPFPLYLDRGVKTKYCGDKDENKDVIGWIGDVRSDCEEVKLIHGYTKAMQTISDMDKANRRELDNHGKVQDYIPLIPLDLNYAAGPFTYSNTDGETLEDFIGHIGLRVTLLFGYLFNSNFNRSSMNVFAEQAGKADAYNYYLRGMTKDEINERILSKLGKSGERSVDDIIEVLQCSEDKFSQYFQGSKSSRYVFELINGGTHYDRARNSMLVEGSSNSLIYNYIFVNNKDGLEQNDLFLLPTRPSNFKGYISEYVTGGNPFKIPSVISNINNSCITLNDYDIKKYYNGDINMEKYINPSVCNIFNDSSKIEQIISYYNLLKDGEVNIRDYKKKSDLSSLIKTLWKVSDEYIRPYYVPTFVDKSFVHFEDNIDGDATNNSGQFVFGSLKPKNQSKLLPETVAEAIQINSTDVWSFRDWYSRISSERDDDIVINTINNSANGIESYTIPEIPIAEKRVINSLFGHPFYYMQNKGLENETEFDKVTRITRSKALLFLHSIPIDCNKLNIGKEINNGGIYRIPRVVTLLIGGLLWRNRLSTEKNLSDIFVYDDGLFKYKAPVSGSKSMLCHPLRYGIINVNDWGTEISDYFGYDIFSLRDSIKNLFIKEFENWSTDNNGFKMIQKHFELFNKNGSSLSTKNLMDYSSEWAKSYGNGKRTAAFSNPKWIENFLDKFGRNFLMTYSSFFSGEGNTSFRLLNREESVGQEILKKLYVSTDILTLSTYAVSGTEYAYPNQISFDIDLAKTYFGSVVNTLESIVNDRGSVDQSESDPTDLRTNRDINIAMYIYLKNIYDKWLIGYDTNTFTVENFFNNNFIIIDSFYCDIKDKLIINCDYFMKRYYDMADNNIFSFLADIYAHHGMLFFPMSSFVDFSKDDVLNDMFKPLPFNSKPVIDESIKFICMYVYEPSKHLHLGEGNSSYGYKNDGFDIWTPEGGTSIQPRIFLQNNSNFVNENTKYAYNIPSFGVAFGKANQSYFKNISLNMDNPITTEYSIKAIWDIAKLGSDTTKVQFIGQDLYSVWSNYSYMCEVEMLGCAQVQPLMYFQLLNISMFRGTYIIIKVSHNISAGNMSTKFVGVRLSKNAQPYNTQPFGMLSILSRNGSGYFGEWTNNYSTSPNGYLSDSSESYYKFNNPEDIVVPSDDCGCNNGSGWGGLSPIMKKLFYALRDSVESIPGNENGKEWTICVSSGIRPNSENTKSDHILGNAMDLQIKKNGIPIGDGQDKRELGIVFDIIVTTYYPYIKQLIMEYRDVTSMQQNFNLFNTIHFASLGKNVTKNPTIYQSYNAKGNNVNRMYKKDTFSISEDVINNDKTSTILLKDNTKFSENVKKAQNSLAFISPYYKNTSKKKIYSYLPDNIDKFKNIFTSFNSVDDTVLKYYFGLIDNNLFGLSYLSKNKGEEGFQNQKRCTDVNAFAERLEDIAYIHKFNPNWLMIVMASESGLDPSRRNKSSNAVGLIQIMPEYYNRWKVSMETLQNMDATAQLEYVGKYLSEWENAKYIHPVDMYLVTLAPAILFIGNRNASSVVYSSDSVNHPSIIPSLSSNSTSQYNGNKGFDVDNKGYITIKDVQNRFVKKAYEFAKTEDEKTQLNYILSSSTYV